MGHFLLGKDKFIVNSEKLVANGLHIILLTIPKLIIRY